MLKEILIQAWISLRRQPTRSLLTMLGIVWGIVAVTLLMAYGAGFRTVLMNTFNAFGNDVIIAWPGTTSEQAGGERAGKPVHFQEEDVDEIRASANLIKRVTPETVKRFAISHEERVANCAIRGVYPEYGELRNEVPLDGRWIDSEDVAERRHVVFLGARIAKKIFAGYPPVGQNVRINGIRFLVVGVMDTKFSDSNYFSSDDESAWIPYTTASDMWDTRNADVLVLSPVSRDLDAPARAQLIAAVAQRQHFSPSDKRAITMFGQAETRPIMVGISYGLEFLLLFVGLLTLGIGGVGVMNIMLVSVNERIREIGLRRALGARRRHIRMQFLVESLALTMIGGIVGVILSVGLGAAIGTLPFLGPAYEDTSGKVDIHMHVSGEIIAASVCVLMIVGVLSGWIPAFRAARLDPVEALRYE
jgi:putative ABC transport system permease protein